jgi:putative protease
MIICAPLHNPDDIEGLVQAGAGEFYAGVASPEWNGRYGANIEMNRRGFWNDANLQGLEEVGKAAQQAHAFGARLFLTVNHLQYTEAQIPVLRELLTECHGLGVDGFILADLNIIMIARQMGLRVVVGTTAAAANHHCYAFYQRLGVFRIIANRDMTFEELDSLRTAFPDLGMEVFMSNTHCRFTDGACFALHTVKDGAICQFLRWADYAVMTRSGKAVPMAVEAMFVRNHTEYARIFRRNSCGLCAMWRLIRMGVDSCKLVGRENTAKQIQGELQVIAQTIRLALEADTEEKFLASIPTRFDDPTFCSYGYQCFFPQLRRHSFSGASGK